MSFGTHNIYVGKIVALYENIATHLVIGVHSFLVHHWLLYKIIFSVH